MTLLQKEGKHTASSNDQTKKNTEKVLRDNDNNVSEELTQT